MPPPLPYTESQEFWAGCKKYELHIQKCNNCAFYRHPPLPICPECQSWDSHFAKVSGKGIVQCFTIVTRALFPGLPIPYNITHVELEEQKGLIMISNLIDCDPHDIFIGMNVNVVFEDVSSEITMFYFEKSI